MAQRDGFRTFLRLSLPIICLASVPALTRWYRAEPQGWVSPTKDPVPVMELLAAYSGRTSTRIVGRWRSDTGSSVVFEFLPNGTWRNIAIDGRILDAGKCVFLDEHTMQQSPGGYKYRVHVGVNSLTTTVNPGGPHTYTWRYLRSKD